MTETQTQEKPKPVCPECKEELTYLHNRTSCPVLYEFSLNERGGVRYSEADYGEFLDGGDYQCPHCYEVLAENEEEAIEILKGSKKDG